MKVGDYVRIDNGCICKVLQYTDISNKINEIIDYINGGTNGE